MAQLEISFSQLLEHRILSLNGNNYTAKTVIEWYANKAGGAHYSTRLPEDFATLLLQSPLNLQPLANILTQLGDAVLLAGHQLLKKLVNLEIHALVVIPPQPREVLSETNYLFDSHYAGSPMRLSLVLDKRLIPSFFVRGLQGTSARVDSDRIIDWSMPRHLHAALKIEEDLSTVLELSVDGVRVGRLRIEEPLFVLSDPLDYETYHNRSVEGSPQEFSFGLAHLSLYGAELSPIDAAKLFAYIHVLLQNMDLPLAHYFPRSYAHAPKGKKDLEMTGTVQYLKVSDVLKLN